jgi:vancomycin resistance protein YoaR
VTPTAPLAPLEARPAGPSPLRRGLLVAGVAVAALVVVYLALVAATGDGLPRGAQVLGVDVGGQSEAQAAATLEKTVGVKAESDIVVVVGTDRVTIVPADAGLGFDAEATVAGLGGRSWNPVTLLTQFTGGPTIDPVITVDEPRLAAEVATIAADADTPAIEPTLVLRGASASLSPGKNGALVDQPASVEAISSAYLVSLEPVTLPIVVSSPAVSEAAAQQALADAKVAISAPVTVKVDTISAAIPAAAISEALTYTSENGALVPVVDGAVLRNAIAPAIESVETPGRDATWNVSSGRPVVVPSKVGRGVNADLLGADVLAVLDSTDAAGRTISAQIGTIEPKLTTQQATALGVVEELGSFKQKFPYAAYRFQNIGTAAKYINGTLLLPGDTFSLNDTIKERTPANGYTTGFVIGAGGIFKEDLGGGVSTSATTTWTAAFYSGLERVSTTAHSIWIPRYRAGLEATVAWGAFDMKFKNDTPHGVYITTIMKDTSLTVTMWGTKVYSDIRAESSPRRDIKPFKVVYDDTPTCHAQGGQEGFTIDVFRIFIKGGTEVKREKITTRYRPSPTVKCGVDPAKKPTVSPSPSVSGSLSPSPSTAATKPASPKPSPSAT